MVLNPRFGNNILVDGDTLRQQVDFQTNQGTEFSSASIGSHLAVSGEEKSFMDKLLDENKLHGQYEDKSIRYRRNTSVRDHLCYPLQSWELNTNRFFSDASVAWNVLSV